MYRYLTYIFGYSYDKFCEYYTYYFGTEVDDDVKKMYKDYKIQKNESILDEILREMDEEFKIEQQKNKINNYEYSQLSRTVYWEKN